MEIRLHYYQFNIGDYIKHTTHLTNDEDLCYRRLLDLYYDTEQPIPNDIPWVSRRLRMGSDVVKMVLDEFFVSTENGYKNPRADQEIADYHAFLNKQRLNGKLGGRPKKTQRKPTANPDLTQVEPKKTLNTNHKTENNKKSVDQNFELFWDTFADKRSRGGAEKAWSRINPDAELANQIIDGAKRYVKTRGTERKYWKQAQGWLNDKRWMDEVEPENKYIPIDDPRRTGVDEYIPMALR